jgi:hypothetical protein
VNGESFAAYGDARALWVVEAPIRVRLQRDESQLPPGCERLDGLLGALQSEIENCKPRIVSPSCDVLRMLIDVARSEPDTIGQSALAQTWHFEPIEPKAATTDVVAAAASATTIDPKHITLLRAPRPLGTPMQISLLIDPAGTSWASQLLGLVDFEGPGVAYDVTHDAFVTRDRALACGILAGDVQIVWEQAAAQVSPANAFEPGRLWPIYRQLQQRLRGSESATLKHALRVGVAIGEALRGADLADGLLDRRIDFLLDALFEGDALEFRDSLSEQEIEGLAASTSTTNFERVVPWIGGAS